jgi:NADH:ubiquinone reductase (H+-translocating)
VGVVNPGRWPTEHLRSAGRARCLTRVRSDRVGSVVGAIPTSDSASQQTLAAPYILRGLTIVGHRQECVCDHIGFAIRLVGFANRDRDLAGRTVSLSLRECGDEGLMPSTIVVAGGGFGGLYAARTLERLLPNQSTRVKLVSETNFLLYTPLLPGAAGASLEVRHVVVPLRHELKRTELILSRIVAAEPARRVLQLRSPDGEESELEYDQLIVSLGSISRTLPIPGLIEHGIGLKTLGDAFGLRNRITQMLEIAEGTDDERAAQAALTFVVVGAGYAGVEGIAEMQDFATEIIDLYPRCRLRGTRWVLIEARDRLMPEISDRLADFTHQELQRRGIEVRTGTTLEAVTDRHVSLSDGECLPTRTVVWTAGVSPPRVTRALGFPVDNAGRIRVDTSLRVEERDREWAIGDCAAVPDPAGDGAQICPPTAQHAMRQGRLVARNVAAQLGHGRVRPFTYKTLGVFVDLGRKQAVAETMGVKWRGTPAWFLARTYHLSQLPGGSRRARLILDWTVDLAFGRYAYEVSQMSEPPALGERHEDGLEPTPVAEAS